MWGGHSCPPFLILALTLGRVPHLSRKRSKSPPLSTKRDKGGGTRAPSIVVSSVLPTHIHRSRAAAGDRVLMVRAVLPGHSAVGGDLDELELHLRSDREGCVQEPVGIVGIEHGADGCVEGGAPVSEFNGAAGEKNVIAGTGWSGVIYGESYRGQLRRQHGELDRVGGGSHAVLQLSLVDAIGHAGHGEGRRRVGPRLDGSGCCAKKYRAGRSSESF